MISARWWSSDPALIGTEVQVPVLLSDDADQYLKGYQTDIVRASGTGTLTLAPKAKRSADLDARFHGALSG